MNDFNASILKKGQKGKIQDIDLEKIPLKLIEMGCLPGNEILLEQKAPFGDPLFFSINEAKVAIRKSTAQFIFLEKE